MEKISHFFSAASRLMRQALVEQARKHAGQSGSGKRVYLEDVTEPAALSQAVDLLTLDEALRRLEKFDAQQGHIVELRYFGGLSVEETAEATGVSPRTVRRDWSMARVWLHREMRAS